jgi:cell division protein FtsI (penicillin-binding protein 3)
VEIIRYSGKAVRDSHKGGYGKYLWLEDSSYPQIPLWFRRFTKITKNNPSKFVNHVNSYGLNKKLNMDFEGKANLLFRNQAKNWSNISLDGLRLWSLSNIMQTLAFYNAVANNGVLVKPQFVSEIKSGTKPLLK